MFKKLRSGDNGSFLLRQCPTTTAAEGDRSHCLTSSECDVLMGGKVGKSSSFFHFEKFRVLREERHAGVDLRRRQEGPVRVSGLPGVDRPGGRRVQVTHFNFAKKV